jgi:thiol-disulfide isomerase/thioredoxin
VNQLEDVEEREKQFDSLAALFGKSDDKQVAAYGRRIAGSDSSVDDLVNTKMELSGVTAAGAVFNWQSYRERWVVVDFWATWCGPCRRAMPELRKLAEQYKDRNLVVVGVSLDEDLKALAEYLGEEDLPWAILAGAETNELAKKYGVRGIPQLFLVDGEGTIRFITHRVDEMAGHIAKQLP